MTVEREPRPAAQASQRLIAMAADRMDPPPVGIDPGVVVLTCANCGAPMGGRKCKLICDCGYFLSCSDYC